MLSASAFAECMEFVHIPVSYASLGSMYATHQQRHSMNAHTQLHTDRSTAPATGTALHSTVHLKSARRRVRLREYRRLRYSPNRNEIRMTVGFSVAHAVKK